MYLKFYLNQVVTMSYQNLSNGESSVRTFGCWHLLSTLKFLIAGPSKYTIPGPPGSAAEELVLPPKTKLP